MVTAFVLLTVERDKINTVAETLANLSQISEVYSTAGRFDLVAVVRVKDNEALAELITNRMLKISGILNSETLIAFRAYSRYDLERLFSVGMDGP